MGAKHLFLFAVAGALPMIALFPVMNTLARFSGVIHSGVWSLVGLQVALLSFTSFAYGITFMYISASSPNRASVGATNGLAQMVVSVMRAVGPAAANSAFSISMERQYLGGDMVYCVMADEETPLLRSSRHAGSQAKSALTGSTPLPWRQFSIILSLQVLEPMTSQVISPFAPQLIRDIGVTNGEEARVGFYVGLLVCNATTCLINSNALSNQQSLFFATEAFTTFHWSRLSDLVGRRPILLIGLSGISISMYSFGLSRTFWSVILRYVGGLSTTGSRLKIQVVVCVVHSMAMW
ncbi:hypothetical protein AZE42_03758 [Rhizopogon vesiculosus]|uniref:Major facilitator superfamily (MFS) profile domain-containing protein n=1 Tax=Rhizopogon vesiculosus TaxID=180088 RepID=A0A1J8QE22_9AGAM|nr:hypothetical protein AZE42_03758 [Rhizopogon vesiculosus]